MYSKEKQSFGLVRTNAALTGNVKLTVTPDYKLTLNSIDGHPSLADIKFKAIPTTEESSYHQDLSRFFGNISPTAIFNVDSTQRKTTSQDYAKQFDFRYTAGAKRSITSFYKEQFSFFAPLHVGETLPDTFVIYRLAGAAESGEINPYDQNDSVDYVKDLQKMLKDAKLVASYDFSTSSTLGKYLVKTTNHLSYVPQSFVFRKDEDLDRYYIDWSGISVKSPVLATLTEDVTYTFKNHSTILDFEQYITESRTRLGLADHRIINLEFMFDDPDASDYSVNRYVGFYATAEKTGSVYLDGSTAYKYRDLDGNLPRLKRDQGGAYSADGDFYQQNPNGVHFYVVPNSGVLPLTDNIWIKSRGNQYHGFKTGLSDVKSYELILDNKKINLGDFRGTSNKQLTVPAKRAGNNAKSFFEISLTTRPGYFDKILIEHPLGTSTCKEGFGPVDVTLDNDYYLDLNSQILYSRLETEWVNLGSFEGRLPLRVYEIAANDFSDALPDLWKPGASYTNYFNNLGTDAEVLNSICGAINGLETEFMIATVVESKILVHAKAAGQYNSRRIFSTFDCGSGKNKIYNFNGGARNAIRYTTTKELATQAAQMCYVSRRGVEIVKSTVLDLDNSLLTGKLDKFIIELSSEPLSATQTQLFLYEPINPEIGKFNFQEWRELDGDFFDTSYAVNEVDLIRAYYDIPDSLDFLDLNKNYMVGGSGSISNGVSTYAAGSSFKPTQTFFKIVSGFPLVYENNFIDEDLTSFRGVSSLTLSPSLEEIINGGLSGKSNPRIQIVNPSQRLEVFNARDRFTRFIATNEYDSLKENFTTTHSFESRTLPWISKWVHLFGTDTRDNAYRFNMSTAFGKTNLSPSFFTKIVSPDELTHEWFYIEGLGRSQVENSWHINDIFDIDNYIRNTSDEFARFFKNRYASFQKSTSDCVCLFKGVEYRMPSRVEGYKFSIVLKRSDPTPGLPPITTYLYENSKFKNVVMLIDVSLTDYRTTNNVIDHLLMYAGQSLKSSQTIIQDNYLSSGLDFSNASVHKGNLIVPIINRHNSDLRNEIVDVKFITGLTADYPYGYYKISAPSEVNANELLFPASTVLKATEYDSTSFPLVDIILPFMTRGFWQDNLVKVIGGGSKLFHRTMERLSFGYFNQNIYENPNEVLSYFVTDAGLAHNSMDLSTEQPVIVSKQNNPYYSVDDEIPASLTNIGNIGYKIEDREEVVSLTRYSGPYVPKTRQCIWFDESGLISNESGIIKNFHGIKVGEPTILTDLGGPNAYRLVGEFPMFATDFDIFKSSWAKDFYKNYLVRDKFVDVAGTKILKEQDNIFGNMLMNLPKEIYIETFSDTDFAVDGGGTITVVDLKACVAEKIAQLQPELFLTVAGPDYMKLINDYVDQNVMNLYLISDFIIFVKPKKELPYEFVSLQDSDKFKQGFVKTTAVNVELQTPYVYSIDVAGNLNGSYQYTASILLELI